MFFEPEDLSYCELTALKLHFTASDTSQIQGVIFMAFKSSDGSLSQEMELPVTFKII